MDKTKMRRIYGASLAVAGLGVFIWAVALALAAHRAPPEPETTAPKRRHHRPRRLHRRPTSHRPRRSPRPHGPRRTARPTARPVAAAPKAPRVAPAARIEKAVERRKPTPPSGSRQPAQHIKVLPQLGRPLTQALSPASGLRAIRAGYPVDAAERDRRRKARLRKQADNLARRIQSMEQRIEQAKEDGRSQAQIEHLEQTLDRMKRRLETLEGNIEGNDEDSE